MMKPQIIAAALIGAAALQLGVARADPGVPALQVMAPNGAKSLLIGTLPAAAAGLRQPAATVLDGAKRYVVEGLPGKGVPPDIGFCRNSAMRSSIAARPRLIRKPASRTGSQQTRLGL